MHLNRAHGFHFLLVKCVLKCGLDQTLGRTSASLNHECFHGHQVKLKRVHFTLFTLEVGSKNTYILLEALVRSQQMYLKSVFTHVASICANLWEQKKAFTQERVQLSQDCFGTPIWPRWRHVKTLYSLRREREGGFRARAVSLPNSILLPFRVKHLDLHSESRVMHLESQQPNAWTS